MPSLVYLVIVVATVALPCVAALRPRLVRSARVPEAQSWTLSVGDDAFGRPPGYYPEPDPNPAGRFLRWWDGTEWAPPIT
jgi:hypothetical protein